MYSCCSQLITFRVTTSVCGSYLCVCVCMCVCVCVCVSPLWMLLALPPPPPCAIWLVRSSHYLWCQWRTQRPSAAHSGYTHCHTTDRCPAGEGKWKLLYFRFQSSRSDKKTAILYKCICLQCNQSNFVCFNKVLIWFILWVNVAYALSPA